MPDLITDTISNKSQNKMELTHKICLAFLFISVISISYSITKAQTFPDNCSTPEATQFDFWIGTWEGSWQNENGVTEKGTNVISKILGSCVVEENFSTEDGTFIGKSVSVYNSYKKSWQQTWVDNSGAYLDFTGGLDGDRMIMSRKSARKDGSPGLNRMVFYDITKNDFQWNWESSIDDGKTWTLLWKIHYVRKN